VGLLAPFLAPADTASFDSLSVPRNCRMSRKGESDATSVKSGPEAHKNSCLAHDRAEPTRPGRGRHFVCAPDPV